MPCDPNDPANRSVVWLTQKQAQTLRCELAELLSGDKAGAFRILALRRRPISAPGSPAPAGWAVPVGSLREIRAVVACFAAAWDATPGAVLLAAFKPSVYVALPLGPTDSLTERWLALCLGPGELALSATGSLLLDVGTLADLGPVRQVELRSRETPCQALLIELIPRPSWREMFAMPGG